MVKLWCCYALNIPGPLVSTLTDTLSEYGGSQPLPVMSVFSKQKIFLPPATGNTSPAALTMFKDLKVREQVLNFPVVEGAMFELFWVAV